MDYQKKMSFEESLEQPDLTEDEEREELEELAWAQHLASIPTVEERNR